MKHGQLRRRRITVASIVIAVLAVLVVANDGNWQHQFSYSEDANVAQSSPAAQLLADLPVKGRAPKTNYSRDQFGAGWGSVGGCTTRNIILHRDLAQASIDSECNVLRGVLQDPYTGKTINFKRGAGTSNDVQIDHVVALSDAWQKGAQQLTVAERTALANDPLELLAVDGPANQQKSDGDAATWLPSNKSFRCAYVARQIAVKLKYKLWVTPAEKSAMLRILSKCPGEPLPTK